MEREDGEGKPLMGKEPVRSSARLGWVEKDREDETFDWSVLCLAERWVLGGWRRAGVGPHLARSWRRTLDQGTGLEGPRPWGSKVALRDTLCCWLPLWLRHFHLLLRPQLLCNTKITAPCQEKQHLHYFESTTEKKEQSHMSCGCMSYSQKHRLATPYASAGWLL